MPRCKARSTPRIPPTPTRRCASQPRPAFRGGWTVPMRCCRCRPNCSPTPAPPRCPACAPACWPASPPGQRSRCTRPRATWPTWTWPRCGPRPRPRSSAATSARGKTATAGTHAPRSPTASPAPGTPSACRWPPSPRRHASTARTGTLPAPRPAWAMAVSPCKAATHPPRRPWRARPRCTACAPATSTAPWTASPCKAT